MKRTAFDLGIFHLDLSISESSISTFPLQFRYSVARVSHLSAPIVAASPQPPTHLQHLPHTSPMHQRVAYLGIVVVLSVLLVPAAASPQPPIYRHFISSVNAWSQAGPVQAIVYNATMFYDVDQPATTVYAKCPVTSCAPHHHCHHDLQQLLTPACHVRHLQTRCRH
jgi:hypothetical protein